MQSGGSATVYKALHEPSGTPVALKIFVPPADGSGDAFKRAKREVVALQMCTHPHIITVHGSDFTGELGYIAVELVDGKNIQALFDRRRRLDMGAVIKEIGRAQD